jgi:hypothetical protein
MLPRDGPESKVCGAVVYKMESGRIEVQEAIVEQTVATTVT